MKITDVITEAASPAQQAAKAIAMKKAGKKPRSQGSLNEFAPGSSGGESGRWYTDDQITDIVGDGWWNDLDVSGASIGVPDGRVPKKYMIQEAQAWLDDQGFDVHVLNVKVNDDDCDWYIEGSFQNPGFAKRGVAESYDDTDGDYRDEIASLENQIKHTADPYVRSALRKQLANLKAKYGVDDESGEQGVAEATGDPKFDKMLKGITSKKQVAKQQKTDTKQQSRDAFGGMFGGGNPANSLGIRKKGVAEHTELAEEFDLIESIVEMIAEHNGVDADVVWADLESLTEDELYVFAVTSDPLMESEAWQKANKRDKTDGMSQKAVNTYRREHPGSKLKTAVTTKPSKLKKGSKASKRRKSYCSRSRGQMKMHSISCAKTPDKAICKARRRWNC